MKRCNKKKSNGVSPVKAAMAVAGIAATSIFLYEQFNKMHDKKIRQCFERFECNFDDEDETLYECDDLDDNFGTIAVDNKDEHSCCCGNDCGCNNNIDSSNEKKEDTPSLNDDENNA